MTPLSIKQKLVRARKLAVEQKKSGTQTHQSELNRICSHFEAFARRGDQSQKNLAHQMVTELFESTARNRPDQMLTCLYPTFVFLCGERTANERPCAIDWSLLLDSEPVSAAA